MTKTNTIKSQIIRRKTEVKKSIPFNSYKNKFEIPRNKFNHPGEWLLQITSNWWTKWGGNKNIERHPMFMNQMNQYSKNTTTIQSGLYTQCSPYQNTNDILFKKYFIFIFIWCVWVSVCVCIHMSVSAHGVHSRALDSLELEL